MKLTLKGLGTSLVVQWVRLCAPNAGGPGSIPGLGGGSGGTRSRMHDAIKKKRSRVPHLKPGTA